MPWLIWLPPAPHDNQRLSRFSPLKNIGAARRAVAAIHGSVKIPAQQSKQGPPIADMAALLDEERFDFGNRDYVVEYRHDSA